MSPTIVLLLFSFVILINSTVDIIPTYHSSCLGLQDGIYKLKLMSGDYPIVTVKCSNEYIILDYNLDKNIQYYFKSWEQWHLKVVGPSNEDIINWEEWYLPNAKSNSSTSFLISPDCSSCHESLSQQFYGQKTTYWMTVIFDDYTIQIKGAHNCDVDWDTYTCYSCSSGIIKQYTPKALTLDNNVDISDYESTGICPVNIRASNKAIETSHYDCVTQNEITSHLKPSLGIDGEFCVCTKPKESHYYYKSRGFKKYKAKKKQLSHKSSVSIELYQSDFEYGTYRIKDSGTYTIMEDIIFDFNSGDINDPQAADAWWPTIDQSDDYPGAGKFKDAYFMGFFAGITIECSDVILDLNGHTIKMSDNFYYQQRWFVGIELTTQYFLPGQGFGNFGASPKIGKNVIVRDGTVGLSSHHGIHGNNNENIVLNNLNIINFETHGIQFNGFNNIKLINVNVGETSNKMYFNGEYSHMRALLPRMRAIAIESGDKRISFYNRDESYTMQDIIDKIEFNMNLIFKYVTSNFKSKPKINVDCTLNEWNNAKKLFLNKNGIPNGAAQYGIFLNTFGASVFTYNLITKEYSNNAYLKNIKIYNMKHKMKEHLAFRDFDNINFYVNSLVAPLNPFHLFGEFNNINELINPNYVGSLITDAYIAMEYFSDNWNYLGSQVIGKDILVKWATTGDASGLDLNDDNRPCIFCNFDVMIHSGKGINGLRIDGVKNVYVDNLEVHNLHDSTPLGSEICGEYMNSLLNKNGEPIYDSSAGHFRQTVPMQTGFSGNMNQAINLNSAKNVTLSNLNIHGIISDYGHAIGISIWPSNDIILENDIEIYGIRSGNKLKRCTYSSNDLPNSAPQVCGILFYSTYIEDNVIYNSSCDYSKSNINIYNMYGHVGCNGGYKHTEIGYDYNINDKNINISNICSSKINVNKFLVFVPIVVFVILLIITLIYRYCVNNNENNTKYSKLISYEYGSI